MAHRLSEYWYFFIDTYIFIYGFITNSVEIVITYSIFLVLVTIIMWPTNHKLLLQLLIAEEVIIQESTHTDLYFSLATQDTKINLSAFFICLFCARTSLFLWLRAHVSPFQDDFSTRQSFLLCTYI